jgi:Matrixin/Putative peptidoglycan binding domain
MFRQVERLSHISRLSLADLGGGSEGLGIVQDFLVEFGYLESRIGFSRGRLDSYTSDALRKYQRFHGLEATGNFDADTRVFMSRPRCGVPDFSAGRSVHGPFAKGFVIRCGWSRPANLVYGFDPMVPQALVTAVVEAFEKWQAECNISVTQGVSRQHIKIFWRPNSVVGGDRVAASDYPPGCSWIVPGATLPKPIIFDSGESWGSGDDDFDFETIALHEVGHILGLDHSSDGNAVMADSFEPGPDGWKRKLGTDDKAGARALYP